VSTKSPRATAKASPTSSKSSKSKKPSAESSTDSPATPTGRRKSTTTKKTQAAKRSTTTIEISPSEYLARRIADLALSKKAFDIALLDVRQLSDSIDFFVICSADSDRQVKAITDAIYDGLCEEGEKPAHREIREQTWMVLDYITVIVHVFLKERRAFYGLEKLWGDARFIYINSEKDLLPLPS
jgi:ribosome-associated protein